MECDGEFVDNGGNAKACLDAITAWKDSIRASASGSAQCSNGECTAEGEASCECSAVPGGGSDSPTFANVSALLGAGALAFGAVLRRRRRAQDSAR